MTDPKTKVEEKEKSNLVCLYLFIHKLLPGVSLRIHAALARERNNK